MSSYDKAILDVLRNGAGGEEYKAVAASQTAAALSATGAVGDLLDRILVTPGTTSPGSVSIKDGADTAIVVFLGGATSVADLKPFVVEIRLKSKTGGWQLSTGANVSAVGIGNFS